MDTLTPAGNPFLLMLQPEAVLAAVERSERLGGLRRRLCRPLDKPGFGNGLEAGEGDDAADDTRDGDDADHPRGDEIGH